MAKIKNNKIKQEVSKGLFLDLVGDLKRVVENNGTAKKMLVNYNNIKFRKSQVRDLQNSIEFCRVKIKFGNEIPNNYYSYLISRLVTVTDK